ncbi:39S ribosomal protein L46, mitochondrial isoform X2 [Orussus abietinus]|uniref:39S ribosomal protein L46, mitochondrial isoform X2 n=1 Tax=Orussus abietinus TaxID=222816 RepID=UPI0006250281|nr:39S ribosomal protein L46, mitochondrial isoform X2 [Orussus abietinus]
MDTSIFFGYGNSLRLDLGNENKVILTMLKLLRVHSASFLNVGSGLVVLQLKFAALLHQESSASIDLTLTCNKVKWDLWSAVCLERHPVITKPMNELQTRFKKMLNEIEFENSMKSDHELRSELEQKRLEMKMIDIDADVVINETAQDLEDKYEKEFLQFQFAPRITADQKNITDSLQRKLDRNLLLLTEQKLGDNKYWLPPQGLRKEGETMRQAAERVLADACGTQLNVRFYGNAPFGVYKYRYPNSIREQGSYGAKIFYFLAKYLGGSIEKNTKYQWLDRNELEAIVPAKVHKRLSQFLISE